MRRLMLALFMLLSPVAIARAEEPWMTLPPTPTLPRATSSGIAPINGANIWYATFGAGEPILMLHGGLANADYWGLQVRSLARRYRVIVMDSRGHGRSSNDGKPFGYQLMADDALGLLDRLGVSRVSLVGWSHGAILGLDIAMRHPERLNRLFAFAANYNPSGVADIASSPVFTAYMERAGKEYEKLSPTPRGYGDFRASIEKMWDTQPNYAPEQLRAIHVPTWIVDGDHDEAIKRPHTEEMAALIPGAGLLIQPRVSHFSFLQDTGRFNADLASFMKLR